VDDEANLIRGYCTCLGLLDSIHNGNFCIPGRLIRFNTRDKDTIESCHARFNETKGDDIPDISLPCSYLDITFPIIQEEIEEEGMLILKSNVLPDEIPSNSVDLASDCPNVAGNAERVNIGSLQEH